MNRKFAYCIVGSVIWLSIYNYDTHLSMYPRPAVSCQDGEPVDVKVLGVVPPANLKKRNTDQKSCDCQNMEGS